MEKNFYKTTNPNTVATFLNNHNHEGKEVSKYMKLLKTIAFFKGLIFKEFIFKNGLLLFKHDIFSNARLQKFKFLMCNQNLFIIDVERRFV